MTALSMVAESPPDAAPASTGRSRVGVFGLTGCAGDQLVILNCEDELLDLVEFLDIRSFVMASSDHDDMCRLDIAFVEGAVASRWDGDCLHRIRDRSDILVAIGTCAAWGGVPAMMPDLDRAAALASVYGPTGGRFDSERPRPLHEVVTVDATLPGCPIERHEFLSAVASLLHGDLPQLPQYPVCVECRMAENGCLLTQRGVPCLGPLTLAGCHARCPSLGVACIGCRGPSPDANPASALRLFIEAGADAHDVLRKLQTFGPVGLPGVDSLGGVHDQED